MSILPSKRLITSAVLVAATMGASFASQAKVLITQGHTSIPAGNAIAAKDLTISNSKLAFSLAIESAPPWGVARGAIVDIANVLADGSLSNDRVAYADFIPNNWSSWPTSDLKVKIVTDTPKLAVIKVARNFGKVRISTVYSLAAGSDLIEAETTMTNNGEDLTDLMSGFTLWADGGYKFAVPGFAGKSEAPAPNPMSDRFVGYDADWAIALHAPYFNELRYKSRDLYAKHSLKKGASVSFKGNYQVLASGDISPVAKAEIKRKGLKSGTLAGSVKTADGSVVDKPAVVVYKNGAPYIWAIGAGGNYQLELPVGEYTVYASGKGYSDSKSHKVVISSGKEVSQSFNDLQAPGEVIMSISDANTKAPIDAKIEIAKGNKPLIEFFGAKTFFTNLEQVGQAQFDLAPGSYQFKLSSGENFLATAKLVDITVKPKQATKVNSQIDIKTYPTQQGWYSGDLHHHADVLEGSTSPEYLVRSQLAAGLSVTFVSDHDSTKNHKEIQQLSDKRSVPFVPSAEFSSSWGHFNPFPLNIGQALSVDTGVDTSDEIFADARAMGATVIASNHPYIPYGYLSSLEKGTVPGGFNPAIDLIEINSEVKYTKAIEKARKLWNEGLAYYYTAGSDTHDVWNETTGHARMFVFTGGKPTAQGFAQSLKNGRAYVSFGPVIYPNNVMFGDTLKLRAGQSQQISFDLLAVNNLKSVQLIGPKGVIKEQALSNEQQTVSFDVPNIDGWVSLVVEDSKGNKAFSNPVWVKIVAKESF